MNQWLIFILVLVGIMGLVKIVEQITYMVCWLKADNEIKEKLLTKKVSEVNKDIKNKGVK